MNAEMDWNKFNAGSAYTALYLAFMAVKYKQLEQN
jgi:hypothetical protein